MNEQQMIEGTNQRNATQRNATSHFRYWKWCFNAQELLQFFLKTFIEEENLRQR
jgi:hypothetical protein